MIHCYDCGRPCDVGSEAPLCPVHGPRWKMVRSAPCAGVVAIRDGKALLVRRGVEVNYGMWSIPGGFQNLGEHPADAARREFLEEVGLEVRLTGILGVYVDTYGDTDMVQVVEFLGQADGEPRPDPVEVLDVAWFAPEELPDEMAGNHRERIEDWVRLTRGEPSRGFGFPL